MSEDFQRKQRAKEIYYMSKTPAWDALGAVGGELAQVWAAPAPRTVDGRIAFETFCIQRDAVEAFLHRLAEIATYGAEIVAKENGDSPDEESRSIDSERRPRC